MTDVDWRDDPEYADRVLESVVKRADGYELHQEHGWVLYVKDPGFAPQAGNVARFFGQGIGSTVRGVIIFDNHAAARKNILGRVVYYRTETQQRADDEARWKADEQRDRDAFEAHRSETDARIAALPRVFRLRLERFQKNNPDFRWKFEPYELFCCEQAVIIANALKDGWGSIDNRFEQFKAAETLVEQQALVPNLDGGHSGNTFGFAVRLAYWYATQPANVVREHGALTPLVGCKEFGCLPHPDAMDALHNVGRAIEL
jgi:hypothetical protein